MKIGDKMYHDGVEGKLVSDKVFGCQFCCFKPETCPKPNEDELYCINYDTNEVGIFKQVNTEKQ